MDGQSRYLSCLVDGDPSLDQTVDQFHGVTAAGRIGVKLGVAFLDHGVVFGQMHQGHGPLPELTLRDVFHGQQLEVFMSLVCHDFFHEPIDLGSFTFKYLHVHA